MTTIFRAVVATVSIFVVASFTACSTWTTYKDPALLDAEVAILDGYHRFYLLYEERAGISSVDGSKAGGIVLGAGSAKLLPGRHWIEIQKFMALPGGAGFKNCAFELDFLAGHRYKLKAHSLSLEAPYGPYSDLSNGSISIDVSTPGRPTQTLRVATVCAQPDMNLCRKDADCHQLADKEMYRCNMVEGFDFGSCRLLDR